MPKGPVLSDLEKGQILSFFSVGASFRLIARKVNRSVSVVRHFLKDPEGYGTLKSPGRPSKLSERDKRHLLREAVKGESSSKDIRKNLGLNVTDRRVRQVLKNDCNLVFRCRKAAPSLTKEHKDQRAEWARSKVTWSQERWNCVIFSDEKKFNLDGPDGLQYYWHDLRRNEEVFSKRPFGGGSVMIWAAFSSKGKTSLVILEGKQNARKYCKVLENHLLPFVAQLHNGDCVFQQDNASIHTARYTTDWIKGKSIDVLDWPARSPDLNPIENVWGILSRRVYAQGRQFDRKGSLVQCLKECWDEISDDVSTNLINSMQERCVQVLQAKGAKSNY